MASPIPYILQTSYELLMVLGFKAAKLINLVGNAVLLNHEMVQIKTILKQEYAGLDPKWPYTRI
ncbi:hypothetical protein GCM10011412_15270 [Maribacter cobaltidurans]|nr:hypothetical protein GCM10011412_15270 [Maribacter cobaltidurans]